MSEERKKEEQEEDILLKLSMPGKSLQEETVRKSKDSISSTAVAQRPGTVPVTSEKTEKQEEDLLQKITMPGKTISTTPKPALEVTPPKDEGLPTALDAEEVKRLAENIFNSDFKEKKKKSSS